MRIPRGARFAGCPAAIACCAALAAAPAQARPPEFGLNEVNGSITPVAGDRTARARAAGARVLRTAFSWSSTQPAPGSRFDWGSLDEFVAQAARGRLEVLPVLIGTPPWIPHEGHAWPVGEAELAHYAAYSRAVAARYGRGGTFWRENAQLPYRPVKAYQVWNEQNRPGMAPPRGSAPRSYADLLAVTRRALRAVDPKARIVLGGMTERRGSAGRFVRALHEIPGAARDYDVAAIHPYSGRAGESVRAVERFRETLDGLGARARPLWVTEIGWATAGDPGQTDLVVSEQAQARLLRRSFRQLIRQARAWRLERVLWYSWTDSAAPEAGGGWDQHAGLFELRGRKKPAWNAFARAARGSPGGHLGPPPLLEF